MMKGSVGRGDTGRERIIGGHEAWAIWRIAFGIHMFRGIFLLIMVI
jgi:hypothetical protein